jgi:GDP-D-mannose 3',5'-epimerase
MDDYNEVYCLACLMGGMGFIGDEEKYGYDIGVGSTQIILNTIENVKKHCPKAKVFYSSSACVYNQNLQLNSTGVSLKEDDAYPAFPDLLYGWQKLYSEKMFLSSGLNVRIARFHNIFGELGCFDGGKEKAPGALTRKVVMAENGGEIEVWGDGSQSRSFLYIQECLTGIEKLMESEIREPLNIGSDELISINDLAKMVIKISGKNLTIKNVAGIVGVQGRNSDNTKIEQLLGWKPTARLSEGISKLYSWVDKQVKG